MQFGFRDIFPAYGPLNSDNKIALLPREATEMKRSCCFPSKQSDSLDTACTQVCGLLPETLPRCKGQEYCLKLHSLQTSDKYLSVFKRFYLFIVVSERKRGVFHLLIHFSNDHNSQVWAKLKPRARNSVWMWVTKTQLLELTSTSFSSAVTRSWIGSRAADPQTSSSYHPCMECWHPKWQYNPVHHGISSLAHSVMIYR